VTITLEIDVGSWGPECTIDQAARQAKEEALGRIKRILMQSTQADADLHLKRDTLHGVRLVGARKVEVSLVEATP